ncbi:DUF7342 family protein [Halorubrum ejinorense]|uniref:DUF7342 family protein n=1 Tax=Halorubrum ejinorense TaxID=425309 RepID=UPI003CD05EA6
MLTFNSAPDEWTENTRPFERVLSITCTLSEPRPAAYIASEAAVAETTARTNLGYFVTTEVAKKHTNERPTTDTTDGLYHRFQTILTG